MKLATSDEHHMRSLLLLLVSLCLASTQKPTATGATFYPRSRAGGYRPISSDPVALLEEAKSLLPGRNNVSQIPDLLAEAIDHFQKAGDESIEYADALSMFALLSRVSHSQVPLNVHNPIDLALQIAELHGQPDSAVLARALEAKAGTVGRKDRELLLARAFQVRGVRVSEISPEVPLKLSLPIATDKTKGVKRPRVIGHVEPEYPDLARRLGLECPGVMLDTLIDFDGVPGQFHLLKSCGYGFDEMAATALRKWRFKPAVDEDGRAVAFKATVQVSFGLIHH